MAENKVRFYYSTVGDSDENATQTFWIADSELEVVLNHLVAVTRGDPKFRKPKMIDIFEDEVVNPFNFAPLNPPEDPTPGNPLVW